MDVVIDDAILFVLAVVCNILVLRGYVVTEVISVSTVEPFRLTLCIVVVVEAATVAVIVVVVAAFEDVSMETAIVVVAPQSTSKRRKIILRQYINFNTWRLH